MQKLKKLMCLVLSVIMLLSINVPTFALDIAKTEREAAENSSTTENGLKIEVATDKDSYSATATAKVTVTVTNTSENAIENVSAEALFDGLTPVGKGSQTKAETKKLNAGESISFGYSAMVNKKHGGLNFFQKIIMFFKYLFSRKVSFGNTGFDDGREYAEKSANIKFGKIETKNTVKVWYEEKFQEISDEDFNTFQEIRKSIENLSEKEEVINILEKEIKKGTVTNYQISENYITFETVFGIRGIWEDETFFSNENKSVSLDNKSNKVKKTPSGNTYKNIINQVTTSSIISSLGDVVVIRPYRSTDFQYDDFLTTGEIIADSIGVEIDTFDNANATLSVLENLDDYGIIFFDSHGALINSEPYICLTQLYNNQQVSTEDLDSLYIDQNNQIYVNSGFFEDNYIDNDFDDCLVFLGTCYGMFDNSFADTLISKGVDCVYGYTNPVSVSYCNDTLVESMLENLLLGRTNSSTAYNNTVSVCDRTDPWNKETDFVTQQSNDFCLSKTGYTMGVIKDNMTDKVLSNVTVTVSNDLYTTTVVTDENGTFKIKLPVGKYKLTMSLDSYTCREEREIYVEENVAKNEGVLYIKYGEVSGTVIDSHSNKPLQNVDVKFKVDTHEFTTKTNSNGFFSIKLPYDDYAVTFNLYNYGTIETTLNLDCGNYVFTNPIALSALQTDGKVTGVVRDIDNKPLANVLVEAIPKGGTDVINSVTTDNLGNYSLPLGHGEYTLRYSKEGYKTATTEIEFYQYTIKPVETIVLEQGENEDPRPKIGSGDCGAEGSNVKWTLYEDGELVISGQGEMTMYPSWYEYKNSIKIVTIQDGVTRIENYTFNGCKNLLRVKIPNSVTGINPDTFSGCANLTSIEVAEDNPKYSSVDGVLFNNNKTTLIQYPKGNKRTDYTIPKSVTKIGFVAFEGCRNLISVEIPNSVTSIDGSAFAYCTNLTNVVIPNSVTRIGICSFCECTSLTSVVIPNSVTSVEDSAFIGCINLASIDIPNSVTSIKKFAFYDCTSLTSVKIPNGVTSIEDYAFDSCKRLEKITVNNRNCTIYDSEITISDTATIYGYTGSTAEAYAKKYNRKFIPLDELSLTHATAPGAIRVRWHNKPRHT